MKQYINIKNNLIYSVMQKYYYRSDDFIKIYTIYTFKNGMKKILYDKIITINKNEKTVKTTIY